MLLVVGQLGLDKANRLTNKNSDRLTKYCKGLLGYAVLLPTGIIDATIFGRSGRLGVSVLLT